MAPTVVVIGMRGAGKTTVSGEAAKRLGFNFTDLDELITSINGGKLPPQLVEEQGWEGFRRLEMQALEQALNAGEGRPGVIACGGGIIETSEGLERLEQHWPVVMIDRHIDDIVNYLEMKAGAAAPQRASLGEHPRDTYKRRLPRYLRCADFRFPVPRGPQSVETLGIFLARFASQFLGMNTVHLGPDTFFVSLTFPDYEKADAAVLRSVAQGADVLEFRVDLLESLEPANIAQQLAVLRRETTGAPVLYTVRTKEHGGAFDRSEDEYFQLVHLGHQLGAEMLDVECTWSATKIQEVISLRGRSPLVGSFHDFHRMPPREELRGLFAQCTLEGSAAVAKVVVKPQQREDNFIVQEVGAEVSAEAGCAFIGLCLGNIGKLSRVLNRVMCPVTHKALAIAAPGQVSVEDILACRQTMSLLAPPQQFPIVGECAQPLFRALPKLHVAAFSEMPLPSEGTKCGQEGASCPLLLGEQPEEVLRFLALASVGGIAVEGPILQQALVSEMGRLGTEAKVAQAVDTIVVRDGVAIGENCLAAALHLLTRSEASGLVAGAKGTCVIAGGTTASGRVVAGALSAAGFHPEATVSMSLFSESGLRLLASSLAALPKLDLFLLVEPRNEESDTDSELSDAPAWQELLQALERLAPVVVDAGRLPVAGGRRVALLEAAQASGCRTVEGPELLVELVCQRLKRWTLAPEIPRARLTAKLLHEVPTGSMTAAGRAKLEREAEASSGVGAG